MIRFLGASASALAVCTAAHATQPLATAAVFGGSTAASLVCSVSNYSGQTSTLKTVAITPDSGGTNLKLTSNTCGATLSDGTACVFKANIPQPPGNAYYCNVTDADSVTVVSNMRITINVLTGGGSVLTSEPGR